MLELELEWATVRTAAVVGEEAGEVEDAAEDEGDGGDEVEAEAVAALLRGLSLLRLRLPLLILLLLQPLEAVSVVVTEGGKAAAAAEGAAAVGLHHAEEASHSKSLLSLIFRAQNCTPALATTPSCPLVFATHMFLHHPFGKHATTEASSSMKRC